MKIANPTAVSGEEIATNYLAKKGYKIMERNFGKRWGEIDIIALDRDTLVFVEVKTRRTSNFGEPVESINYYKLKSLIRTAQFYKLSHPNLPEGMRIDAVSVKISSRGFDVEHIENITDFAT